MRVHSFRTLVCSVFQEGGLLRADTKINIKSLISFERRVATSTTVTNIPNTKTKTKGHSGIVMRKMSPSKFERLPKHVTPVNYNLTFEPNWENHTFSAKALIDILVNEETTRVTLNAVHFQVGKVEFKSSSSSDVQESEVLVLDNEQELLRIDFAQPLQRGKGTISIDYKGVVNDSLKGLFRSKYKSADGQDKFHYVTKFEPAFARWCFPGWDEPALKSTFEITLIVPKELTAVSNMPVQEEMTYAKDPSKKVVKFERSVKMSTYVMAFAIGEFDFTEGRSKEGVLCRVYTPVGKGERGRYALGIVTKAITFYNDYFGIPYPLPKMDFLAVNEYPCGAMENWGLVTFKEIALLMDEKLSSTLNKHRVALTTTHETAHMWFGNLVTMEWWSDLWLNEGYASFMEYVCTDHIFPEYSIWESFVSDDVCVALELDALKSSHPIQVVVDRPSSVGEIFDAISYNKGSSVIRMLNNFIGEEDFKKGMKLYLSKHQFGNAETEDLWAALAESSGKPVDKVMPTWTKQMGYPILKVKKIVQDDEEKVITLAYEKFWADPKLYEEQCSTAWIIPVSVRKQSKPKGVCGVSLLERNPRMDIELRVKAKPNEWVKLNPDVIGYYRVAYPSEILAQMIPSIKDKTMNPIDRLGMIDDLFANATAGQSSSEDVLKTLLAYVEEDSYTVWSVINNVIGSFNSILSATDAHDRFITYAKALFVPISSKLGWDPVPGESSQNSSLRTIVLVRLVGLKHQPTILEAKKRFDQHVRGEILLHPDLKSAVYRAVLNTDDAHANFEALIKLYRESDLLEEKYVILRALGAARDPDLIQKGLDFGLSDDVNKQDICILMVNYTSKPGREAAWSFFKKHVKHFQAVYPSGGWYLRALVKLPAQFKTEERAQEVVQFFQENKFSGVDRAVEQAVESIRINEAWFKRDYPVIDKFLSSYDK